MQRAERVVCERSPYDMLVGNQHQPMKPNKKVMGGARCARSKIFDIFLIPVVSSSYVTDGLLLELGFRRGMKDLSFPEISSQKLRKTKYP